MQQVLLLLASRGWLLVNSSSPEKNGRRFADDIFKYVFMDKKNVFVPKGPTNNNSALV